MKLNRSKYWLAFLFTVLLSSTLGYADQAEPTADKYINEEAIPGQLIWADLYSADVKGSIDFYTNTFGWTVKQFGDKTGKYYIFYDATTPIAGLLARDSQREETEKALWIGSIANNDISSTLSLASKNKAVIILKPHDFELYGKRAVLADPDGGLLALLELNKSNKQHQNISKKWGWAQLFSIDTKQSASFYQSTFNYSIEEAANDSSTYFLLQQDNYLASIVSLPDSFEQRNRWINFLTVDELNLSLEKAKKNGAKIIHAPQNDNLLAIIADPNGAFIGLIERGSRQ